MKKENNESAITIKKYLTQKLKEENESLNLSEIANHFDFKLQKNTSAFFRVLRNSKIEINKNKRFPYELNLEKISCIVSKKRKIDIVQLIEYFEIFCHLIPQGTAQKFESAIGPEIAEIQLWTAVKRFRLSILDLKILFRTIQAFLVGQHPIYMNDLKLKTEDLIEASILSTSGTSKLATNDLIRITIDLDGVSTRYSITPKTLGLIGSPKKEPLTHAQTHKPEKFCTIIEHHSVISQQLYYTESTQQFLHDVSRIAQKIEKNESLSLLLHGPSGTGKTLFAHQLAKEIHGTIVQLSFPQIQSKYIGETEKNIQTVFEEYRKRWVDSERPVILLLNEADGIMNKRVEIKTSNDAFANHAQTELLEQLERFKGIVIATTNLAKNIDKAFDRRFLFSTEINAPDICVRKKYLQNSLLKKHLEPNQLEVLANQQWTIAEIQKIENQINLMARVKEINTEDVVELLNNESLLENKNKIGYFIK
jgi:DNA polymerase III delta prime subunit